jgi:hypothetical protein
VEVTAGRADAGPSRSEQAKADGGIATFRDLNPGSYVVRLSLPQRCEASGGSTRQLTIAPRRTTAVRFAVTCR